ncbi:MAG TPA: hypothetical protein VNO33_03775 [Kofleriaceae bacterium]|nr:hypothetical protein [Kofleriaceae bacterium]
MSTETEPRKKRALALGLTLFLFGTGVVVGVAVDRWLDRDSRSGDSRRWERRRPEALARKYREKLDLDETQARAVEQSLQRTWGATRRVFEPIEPQVDAIRRRGEGEIRALLRADQVPRFDEMVAEQERRRSAMRQGLDLPSKKDGGAR